MGFCPFFFIVSLFFYTKSKLSSLVIIFLGAAYADISLILSNLNVQVPVSLSCSDKCFTLFLKQRSGGKIFLGSISSVFILLLALGHDC